MTPDEQQARMLLGEVARLKALAQPEPKTYAALYPQAEYVPEQPTNKQSLTVEREWVGLTDEELCELSASGLALWDLWRAIEAKLKEKNT